MEYFSIVDSISVGKREAPCYTLELEGVSGRLPGKAAELLKVRHTVV